MPTSGITVFLLSVLPGILWVWFFYRQDRFEAEPKRLIVKSFLFGALVVIPAGILEAPFRNILSGQAGLLGIFVVATFVVGLVEEILKYRAFRSAVYNDPEFNEVMDGVIYAVSAGLGFATLENVMYISAFGPGVGVVRAVLTNLAHASFSGIVGYHMGLAKIAAASEDESGKYIRKGLYTAIIIHGLYDFIVIGRVLPPLFAAAIIGGSYVYLRSMIRRAERTSPFRNH